MVTDSYFFDEETRKEPQYYKETCRVIVFTVSWSLVPGVWVLVIGAEQNRSEWFIRFRQGNPGTKQYRSLQERTGISRVMTLCDSRIMSRKFSDEGSACLNANSGNQTYRFESRVRTTSCPFVRELTWGRYCTTASHNPREYKDTQYSGGMKAQINRHTT